MGKQHNTLFLYPCGAAVLGLPRLQDCLCSSRCLGPFRSALTARTAWRSMTAPHGSYGRSSPLPLAT